MVPLMENMLMTSIITKVLCTQLEVKQRASNKSRQRLNWGNYCRLGVRSTTTFLFSEELYCHGFRDHLFQWLHSFYKEAVNCLAYHVYVGYDASKEGRRLCELGREACWCIESLQYGKQRQLLPKKAQV